MVCALLDMTHLSLRPPAVQQFACRRFHCRHEQRIVSFFRYSTGANARTFAASM
jgi:hypothetical protein